MLHLWALATWALATFFSLIYYINNMNIKYIKNKRLYKIKIDKTLYLGRNQLFEYLIINKILLNADWVKYDGDKTLLILEFMHYMRLTNRWNPELINLLKELPKPNLRIKCQHCNNMEKSITFTRYYPNCIVDVKTDKWKCLNCKKTGNVEDLKEPIDVVKEIG